MEYEEDFKESYGFQYRTKGRSVVAEFYVYVVFKTREIGS